MLGRGKDTKTPLEILYALQQARTPLWDMIMGTLTYLGGQTVLLGVGMVVIWCIDKKWGYRLFFLGIFGAAVNQLLKAIFLIPRPWVVDPSFQITESARAAATGYSFPSGHTQGAALLFGGLAIWRKKRWIYCTAVVCTLLVGFSRMYLGVHTLLDVSASFATGALVIFFAHMLFKKEQTTCGTLYALGIAGLVVALAAVGYQMLAPASETRVQELDAQGIGDAFSTLGGMLGLAFMYIMDEKYIKFPIKAVWWAQVIKCAVGLGLVLAVRIFLKASLEEIFGGHAAANAIRYFLMAVVGGVLWPMSFVRFSRFGKR